MVSGSGGMEPQLPNSETQGISPQEVVDKYHEINTNALLELVVVGSRIDPRGSEFGGSLFNRTSDLNNEIVRNFRNFWMLDFFSGKCANITR
ncbi:MAG: hypothetical protein CM15mP1_3700 [Methanobacteriota archaeon]|nr:MAG: hypothetical protein CM15mP1_3700 [Euryarchaeota archaeon]